VNVVNPITGLTMGVNPKSTVMADELLAGRVTVKGFALLSFARSLPARPVVGV